MLRHTVGRAYDELAWLAERTPLRTRGTRPVVQDIGYYVPRNGALEVFARIAAGDLGPSAAAIESLVVTLHESHIAWASYEGRLAG